MRCELYTDAGGKHRWRMVSRTARRRRPRVRRSLRRQRQDGREELRRQVRHVGLRGLLRQGRQPSLARHLEQRPDRRVLGSGVLDALQRAARGVQRARQGRSGRRQLMRRTAGIAAAAALSPSSRGPGRGVQATDQGPGRGHHARRPDIDGRRHEPGAPQPLRGLRPAHQHGREVVGLRPDPAAQAVPEHAPERLRDARQPRRHPDVGGRRPRVGAGRLRRRPGGRDLRPPRR